ncbi:MAG TPA: metallophosphoesterase family protein [Arenibaculum sp.]|nr:metallophosphoesterase family protein [Arenibaculum sp.]
MKIAILSDIHSNLEALCATLDAVAAQGAERIVCLGDVVGYNTDAAACVAALRAAGAVCAAGNPDRAVAGRISTDGFSAAAVRAVAWTRGRLGADDMAFLAGLPLKAHIGSDLVMVHGALHVDEGCELVRLDTDERRYLSFEALAAHPSGARVCAFGHTHRLGVWELRDGVVHAHEEDEVLLRPGSWYLVNPGTVGDPRTDERRATCMVFDTERQAITVYRVAYDAAAAFAKTRRAGLGPRPTFLPPPVRETLKWGVRTLGLQGFVRRMGASRASPR